MSVKLCTSPFELLRKRYKKAKDSKALPNSEKMPNENNILKMCLKSVQFDQAAKKQRKIAGPETLSGELSPDFVDTITVACPTSIAQQTQNRHDTFH